MKSLIKGIAVLISFACAFPAFAVDLWVSSNVAENPSATSCPHSAATCHFKDALRIAANNGTDDVIRLTNPSTWQGANQFLYLAGPSDYNRNLTIQREPGPGLGLFYALGRPFLLRLITTGSGNFTLSGINIYDSKELTSREPALSIHSDSGDITLRNVEIVGHSRMEATQQNSSSPAGVYLYGSNATVENSRFTDNFPGAVRVLAKARARFNKNSVLRNKKAGGKSQGAVDIRAAAFNINENSFIENATRGITWSPAALDVGLENASADISTMLQNEFRGNEAVDNGSSVLEFFRTGSQTNSAAVYIDRNVISGNQGFQTRAGALKLRSDRNTLVSFTNNLMFGNHSTAQLDITDFGTVLSWNVSSDGKAYFNNNTIVDNSSTVSPAVYFRTYGPNMETDVYNNIIHSNKVSNLAITDFDLMFKGYSAGATLVNNNLGVTSLFDGDPNPQFVETGTLHTTPLFIDQANHDYHLDPASNLVNGGAVVPAGLPVFDMDGQARIQAGIVDIGADETSGAQKLALTVVKSGVGSGVVSSTPTGLSCDSSCASKTGLFDSGSDVTLNATPDIHSVFTGWSGLDCSASTQAIIVTMSSAKSCTANFTVRTYSITVNVSGSESGSIGSSTHSLGTWLYPLGGSNRVLSGIVPGATVNFGALALGFPQGSVYWSDCETSGGTAVNQYAGTAECNFTNLQSDKVIHVVLSPFVLFPSRNVTVNKAGSGQGSVTSTPSGLSCDANCIGATGSFFLNTDVDLNAVAAANSVFAGWSGDCTGTQSQVTLSVSANKTCNAIFDLAYQMSINVSGNAQGTVEELAPTQSQIGDHFSSLISRIYPFTSGGGSSSDVVIRASSQPNATVTFSGCSGTGFIVTGNSTAQAQCAMNTSNGQANLGLIFLLDQYVVSVTGSGVGTGIVTSDVGALVMGYPASNSAQSQPLNYAISIALTANAYNSGTATWTNCNSNGAYVTGNGTANAVCNLGLYAATTMNVVFDSGGATDEIFMNSFE